MNNLYTQAEVQEEIKNQMDIIYDLLISKNDKYGNSAIEPIRVFSKASPEEQILVRMDDKISRIISGQTNEDEDVLLDLVGYIILLRTLKSLKNK